MEGLYQWVGSILCYLILVSAVRAVLPSGKYEKYIRFFIGVLLILVVVQPVTRGLQLEDRLAYYFEAISFQRESEDLKREILGVEEQRLERVIAEYERAVEKDVKMMAEDMGFQVEKVEVTIESERGKEDYGTVNHVFMVVEREIEDGTDGNMEEQRSEMRQKDLVGGEAEWEKIQIGTIKVEPIEAGIEVESEGTRVREADAGVGTGQNLEQLRRKVERYYGLEDWEVEMEYKSR